MAQIGVALDSLSPEGRGWGEGALKLQNNLQLPNPLILSFSPPGRRDAARPPAIIPFCASSRRTSRWTCSCILAAHFVCVRVLPKATLTKSLPKKAEWSAGRRRGRGPRHADGCCHPPTLRAWRAPQNDPLARTACFGRAAPPGAPPPSRFSAAAVDRRCTSSAPAPRGPASSTGRPHGERNDSLSNRNIGPLSSIFS
jgi:hypothetical protein